MGKNIQLRNVCLALASLFAAAGIADDCVMHVTARSGETVDVTFSEQLHGTTCRARASKPDRFIAYTGYYITDAEGNPKFETSDGVITGTLMYEINLADLEAITFSGLSSAEQIHSEMPAIEIRDRIMRISGVREPIHLTIATISGIVEIDSIVSSDTEISLSRCSSGIHTITVGKLNFKILIR